MILSKLALSTLFGILTASSSISLDQQTQPTTNNVDQVSALTLGIQKHDPHRLQVMRSVLESNPINMPLVLIKEIEGYNFDKPVSDLYEKVMHKLEIPLEEWTNFSFYEKNFANLLIGKLAAVQDQFDEDDSIWKSSQRILFKWLFYMNEPENRRNLNKDTLKGIKKINSLISSESMSDFPKGLDFLSMNSDTRYRFANLLDYEFIERGGVLLFSTFSSLLDDFYLKKIEFEELINKYFGGDTENNLLLKFMIIAHDPIGDIAKNFPESKKKPFSNRSKLGLIEITPEYLRDISLNGPKSLDVFNDDDLSETIFKFYSTTGRAYRPTYSHDHDPDTTINLLESLKENKSLNRETLETMFKFPFYNDETSEPYYKWDEYRLEQLINNALFTNDENDDKGNFDIDAVYEASNLMTSSRVLKDLYQKVMNRLRVSDENRNNFGFRFHDQGFPNMLYQSLVDRDEILPLDLFWHDLRRLLFKWIVFSKSCGSYESKSMEALADLISKKSGIALPIDIDPKTMQPFEMFSLEELMNHELLENRHYIGSFVSAVDAFYNKKIGCDRLMEVLGSDKHDANMVSIHLKFMILKYDSLGEMQKCFLKDDEIGILKFSSHVQINPKNLTNLEEEILNDLEVNDFGYLSTFTIKLYLERNRRFLPWNSRDLPILEEKLKEAELPKLNILDIVPEAQYFFDNPNPDLCEWYLAQTQTPSLAHETKREELKND